MSKRTVTSKRHTVAPAVRARAPAPRATTTPAPTPAPAPLTRTRKRAFDLPDMFARLREAVAPFPKAAMFELAERGYASVFHVLVGCIISIRTLDEVSLPTSLKLFEAAPTPEAIATLSVRQIDDLIHACSFHEPKAGQIRDIARRTVDDFQGALPCDFDVLTSFHGVGPKCANLALGIACGAGSSAGISVDIHVHRVTNRWGLVQTSTPEKTMAALHAVLPKDFFIEINALLVPFGKRVCTGALPKCSTCPVLEYCRQVGVTKHR
jgi:endonuclease III